MKIKRSPSSGPGHQREVAEPARLEPLDRVSGRDKAAVVGDWGPPVAAEHMSDAAWAGGGLGRDRAVGFIDVRIRWPRSPARAVPWAPWSLASEEGEARQAPVACAERWPLPGPVAGSSKWRTRQPGGVGRVSHPHKGRGPCPSPAAASCGPVV